MTFEMAAAVDFGIISDQETMDDKYLAFIMAHFLLIMPYHWYGIIKANVMGRSLMHTILTILHHEILFCVMCCSGIYYFAPYAKISLDKNAS